jgi:RimJ/RimL family protein N-acetyltransferase
MAAGAYLREATEADGPMLKLWSGTGFTGKFNDLGPLDEDSMQAALQNHRLIVCRSKDDRPIGEVTWNPVRYGPNRRSRAWNIGINLIPAARGRGFGVATQRRLVERLFARGDVHRIEASTDVENVAEQRALSKAGFKREGVIRGAQFRAGRWHDLVLYGCVREDLLSASPTHP